MKAQTPVNKAIDWVITQAVKLVKAAGKFVKDVFGKKDSKADERTEQEKVADLKKAASDGQKFLADKTLTKRKKKKAVDGLKKTYRLTSIELVSDQRLKEKEKVHIHAIINPTYDGDSFIIDPDFPPEPIVTIEAMVGAPIQRANLEKKALESPGRAGYSGYQRAHLLGPGFGKESSLGIFYAPEDVNQRLQRSGIELLIRAMYEKRYTGAEFRVSLTATPYPGTELLAKANYKLYGRFAGAEWAQIFEYTIKVGVGAVPSVKVLAGETDLDAVHAFSSAAEDMLHTRGEE
jgi:hypothetical protein